MCSDKFQIAFLYNFAIKIKFALMFANLKKIILYYAKKKTIVN